MQTSPLQKQIHTENPLPLHCYGQPVRISRLEFDLLAEEVTPIPNTHPGVFPKLFMAPACLLTSLSHSLHLYCSATSLTWDNQKTKNAITLT